MNKLWAIAALTMATNYGFAAADKKQAEPKPFEGKPAVALQVFDVSTKIARPIKGNTLSIRKKQNQLCWTSVNMALQNQKVTVAEAFYAPDSMNFSSPGSRVDSSADKKSHTVITEVKSLNQSNVNRCWNFENTDPAGKYRVDIQINDQVFKGLEFEIVK